MGERLTEIFMLLFCEKNSDGTKNLRLKGKDLWQRIGKRLVDDDMTKIAAFLLQYPEIVKLDICYNNIGDEGLQILVDDYLTRENNLEYLNLVGCDIGWVGMKHMSTASDTIKLKTLRLTGNKLGQDGGRYAAELLGQSTTLKHLDVGDTDQTLGSVQYFMTVIREDIGTNTTLQVLDLSRIIPNCKLYQYTPAHLAESLSNMLQVNTKLIELHVQKCEFDGHDIELLIMGLETNNTLLLLDLGYNKIGDYGIEHLSDWLKKKPNLLGLNVAGNGIGNTGARALSFGMPISKVRMLDISQNRMTDSGITHLLNSIKKPYMLRLLYIWGNTFGHRTNKIIDRMLLSTVLEQENIDLRLYTVDRKLCAAFYPSDHYKHKYYCVMDHGCPIELRIKRNKIDHVYAQPRALVQFQFYPRFPPVDESLPPIPKPC